MTMSLQSELERFYKSAKFKHLVAEKVRTDRNFGRGNGGIGTEELARDAAKDLRNMLNYQIQQVKGDGKYDSTFPERFYDQFTTTVYFKNGTGWMIDLSFDPSAAMGESLWPEGGYEPVYLPKLFNNGWNASGKVYGYWPRIDRSVPSKQRQSPTRFLEQAVTEFNMKYIPMGITAEYHPIYDSADYFYDDIERDFDDWME